MKKRANICYQLTGNYDEVHSNIMRKSDAQKKFQISFKVALPCKE